MDVDKRTLSLTDGPVFRSVIMFALPILMSNLFQQLYNSVDGMVTGSFAGSLALAAVGATGSLINLLIGFFLGISTGTGVLFAMYYGAGELHSLKRVLDSAFLLSVVAGMLISVPGILFAPQLLHLMNTPEDVMPLAVTYLRIYLAGTVINLIYNTGAGIIRAVGDSKHPLIYLVISGIANLVMDLLFVAVFDWGVAGAALATVLAQVIAAVPVVIHLMHFPPEYRLRMFHYDLDRNTIFRVIGISVPCGLQSSMFNISNLLIQVEINAFGSAVMAGITAYSRIDGFVYMPMMALSLSCSTYVGQNFGAAKYDRAKKGIRICLIASLLCSLALAILVVLLSDYLLRLFTTEVNTLSYAKMMMHYMAPFGWIFAFSDILGGAIRGAGKPGPVTVINGICICLFRIIWLSVLLRFIWDIRIVLACYPVSWLLCSIVTIIYYFRFSQARRQMNEMSIMP